VNTSWCWWSPYCNHAPAAWVGKHLYYKVRDRLEPTLGRKSQGLMADRLTCLGVPRVATINSRDRIPQRPSLLRSRRVDNVRCRVARKSHKSSSLVIAEMNDVGVKNANYSHGRPPFPCAFVHSFAHTSCVGSLCSSRLKQPRSLSFALLMSLLS